MTTPEHRLVLGLLERLVAEVPEPEREDVAAQYRLVRRLLAARDLDDGAAHDFLAGLVSDALQR